MALNIALPAADSCCPKLTLFERIYGWIGCLCIGVVLNLVGSGFWTAGNRPAFAIIYTSGNCVSILGSFFLMGPKRQCRRITAARRRITVLIYFSTMVLTIVVALTCKQLVYCGLLLLFTMFLQWCAMVWYTASFIPYGQKILRKTFGIVAF